MRELGLSAPFSRDQIKENLKARMESLSECIKMNQSRIHLSSNQSVKRDLEKKVYFDEHTLIVNQLIYNKLFKH